MGIEEGESRVWKRWETRDHRGGTEGRMEVEVRDQVRKSKIAEALLFS